MHRRGKSKAAHTPLRELLRLGRRVGHGGVVLRALPASAIGGDGGEPEPPRQLKGDGDRIESSAGGLLEGRDRFEEEVDPLDLDGRGLARVVGGEPVGDGAGAVGALHRRLQQRERHRRRRALHGARSPRAPRLVRG